ncbi:MAG: hypothetical protein FRX48_07918 [Lasallia pustulata]|uniref:J domain-containing protein n=1 Tax=Lasallia pustulata TaxID=136370 RepID=A0A5M8PH47_9LECA|nr:MAG: hypothetical protein FRX48_07918 [Lasallia pustulata]
MAYLVITHESSGHKSKQGLAGARGSDKRRRAAGTDGDDRAPPDHYATLGISRRSTPEEVAKAAEEMRIKTHPDRLRRKTDLSPEALVKVDADAARVGWAADILSDTHMYDAQLQAWDGEFSRGAGSCEALRH